MVLALIKGDEYDYQGYLTFYKLSKYDIIKRNTNTYIDVIMKFISNLLCCFKSNGKGV